MEGGDFTSGDVAGNAGNAGSSAQQRSWKPRASLRSSFVSFMLCVGCAVLGAWVPELEATSIDRETSFMQKTPKGTQASLFVILRVMCAASRPCRLLSSRSRRVEPVCSALEREDDCDECHDVTGLSRSRLELIEALCFAR